MIHVRVSICVIRILIFSDFDDDGTLDCGDLEKLVNCLTGETDDTRLTAEEMRQLINNVSSMRRLLSVWDGVGRNIRRLACGCRLVTVVFPLHAYFLDSRRVRH